MFKYMKKPVYKQDNAETVSTGSGILLEPLEPRILLSAELAIPPQDLAQDLLLADSQNAAIDDGIVFDTPVIGDQPEIDAPLPADVAAVDEGANSEDTIVPGDDGGVNEQAADAEENNPLADSATDVSADSTPVPETETIPLAPLPAETLYGFNQQVGLQLIFVDPSVPEFNSLLATLPLAGKGDASSAVATADSNTALENNSVSNSDISEYSYIDLAAADVNVIDVPVISDSESDSRTLQIFVLDSSRDGLTQITDVLAQYDNVSGVHVLSHGAAGYLRLGNASINNSNLNGYQGQLRDWSSSLTEQADVLLYGCDVADGESGVNFIQRISEFTGADVAASSDDTGSAVAGGDWVLENSTGLIEAPNLFAGATDYNYLLDTVTVSGTTAVDNFVLTANQISDGSTDTAFADGDDIVINADAADDIISVSDLASALSLTVNGEGNDTLDLSSLGADLSITVQTSGDIVVSDGVDSLTVSGIENLIGGSGTTTLDYSLWTDAVSVDLQAGTATDFTSISNINNVLGGSGNDTLVGDAGDNLLFGDAGDDQITGNAGNDRLQGGAGDDSYFFADGWGEDTLTDTEGANTPDFDAVTGILTLSNNAGSIAIGDGVNTVTLNLGASDAIANALLDISSWQSALEGGMQQLSAWAGEMGQYGDMANALPTLGLTLEQVLDARDSIAQLQQRLENYFAEAADAGETPTSDGLLDYLAGLNVDNGAGFNASIAAGMSLDVVIGANGNPELKFNFEYNAERDTTFAIDLGREAAELGVQLDANAQFDLSAQMNLDAALGLSIIDGGADFFLDVNRFDVGGFIDATDLNFGVDIGFLEAAVSGGSIQLDAGLDLAFIDQDSNGANRLSLAELDTSQTDIADLLTLTRQAGNGLNVSLPVSVFNDAAQTQLWDTFGGQTIGVTAADVFSGESPDVSLSDDIRDFNNLSAEEMMGMLNQLDEWLLQLAKSEVLDLEVPLTDGMTVGDALDFGQAFKQDVLQQLAQYDSEGNILRDGNGNPLLNFSSVQTLSEKLTDILSSYRNGVEVLAEYDVDTQDLSFRIEWSRDFVDSSTAVDFDVDLGSFGGIQSASDLGINASADLAFTFGVNLAPNEELYIAPPLFAPDFPDTGVLSGTATFEVALYEESGSGEILLDTISVSVNSDSDNTSIDDLVDDVQAALDDALQAAGFNAGDVVAEYTGNRIALTALPGSTTVDNGDGTSSAQTLDRRVQIDLETTDFAYTELGLMISPAPWDGMLSGTAEFTLLVDDAEYDITVAANGANQSIDELVADINNALRSAVDADGNPMPAGVEAYTAINSNLIVFKVAAEAGVARFGMKDINDVAATELGFDFSGVNGEAGNEPVARGRATEFFIDDASLSGSVTLDASSIEGAANLGFLGVNIGGSTGGISANATLDLYDAENGSSRITLDRLLEKMADGDIASSSSGIVDAGISGAVDVDLSIRPETGIGMDGLAEATVSLDLNIVDWLANAPVMNDSSDPSAIQVSFAGPDINEYMKFENIGFADVIRGLNQAVDYLRDLEGEGGTGGLVSALDRDLPVINRSTSDLLNMADQFAAFVDALEADQAGSAQAAETLIKDYLGLDASSDLVELVLDTTAAGAAALRIDLNYTRGQDLNVPMELNLDRLAGLAGFDGFNDRFGNFVGVSSSGDLGLEVDGSFNLSLGLDLSGVNATTAPTAFMYGGSDGTGLSFDVRALGNDLEFTAQTGPFGISVIGGEVSLGSGIEVFLDNAEYDFGALSVDELNIDITNGGLGQAADISLPVYFPSISSPVGGEGNNIMAITVDNIADFFDGVAGSVSIDAPDFTDLQPLTLFGMLSNPAILVDGLDALLGTLQDGLNSEVLNVNLPFLGDALSPAAQFIEGFREDTLAYLSTVLKQSGADDPDVLVQETLFNIFASEADGAVKLFDEFGGQGLLQDRDGDGIDLDDIEVSGFGLTDTFGQFDFTLGDSYIWDQDIGFDIGLPALGLDLDAGVELGIEWALDFGFGLDQTDGFYFVTENANELEIITSAILTDGSGGPASATGTLGFLQLQAEDAFDPASDAVDDIEYSHLAMVFGVEIDDPNSDGRLTFGEIVSPATGFSDIVSANANGHAAGELDVNVSFAGLEDMLSAADGLSGLGALLPEINFDLAMDWSFLDSDPAAGSDSFGASPEVAFNNIELDLGSFISDFAGPFLEQIGDVLEPLDWLIGPDGMLNKRLPVISDLSGYTVTLASLAELYDPGARITPFLNSVQQIYNLIDMVENAVADANGDSLILNFGNLDLTDLSGGDLRGQSSLSGLTAPSRPDIDLDSIGGNGDAKEFAKTVSSETTVGEGSVDFAILKPANIFGLLLGKEDVNLVTYDLPKLEFNFDYRQSFPVFGPLSATLRGAFNAGVDLAIGYDTLGLSRFLKTDNPGELINGFFVSDIDFGTGEDVVEAWLRGSIAAGASLDLVLAEAGVEGGISTGIDFNLSDLNNDGKVRFSEMGANLEYNEPNPLAVFDISGTIDWFFRAFVEVDLFFFQFEDSMNLGSGNIYSFDIPFNRLPVLAQDVGNDLIVNIGKNAEARLQGNASDGDETITVRFDDNGNADAGDDEYIVSYLESGVLYEDSFSAVGVEKLLIYGGAGNDSITIDNSVTIATEIYGGSGDDTIIGGSGDNLIFGGEGQDRIYARGGNDELYGGEGGDIIDGGAGNDVLYGGAGNDTLRGFAGDDGLYGGLGNDTLEGGVDNDTYYFANDFGNDTVEDSGSNLDRAAGQAGDTWDFTAVTIDITFNFGSAGYLDSDVVKAVNLSNSVTESVSQQFAVETVLGGSGAGGTGSDTFNIYRTADYGSAPGLDVLLLDGQAGSDTYISYFKPAWVPISIPMDVSIRDQGNLWDTDRAIAFGSNSADLLQVNTLSVDSYKPFSISSEADASTVTPPLVDLAGAEKQSFAYGAYGADSGLESLEVIAKRGNDTVFVESTPDYLAASVRGNEGDDVITVGRSAIAGDGLLDNIDGNEITGALVIRGDEDSDTLIIDDSRDNTDNLDGVLTDAYISGMGMTVGIDYGTVETLGLAMGSGNDMFTVAGSIGGASYLTGNSGNDIINIQSASGILQARGGNGDDSITLQNNNSGSTVSLFGESGNDVLNVQRMIEPVTVRGGDDNDIINVGSAAPNAGGMVNFISDLLDVDGETGSDILNLDDTAETEDDALRVTSTLLTGLGMSDGVLYANMEFINIATGSGSDKVDVESTAFGSLTTISTFDGDATINVSSDAPLNNGNLDGIQGELSLFMGADINELNISDRGSDVADDNILITENRITGLAPAAINYFTSGRYDRGVNIWFGEGSDTATVASTHADSITTIWANDGDDQLTAVDADNSADDGLLVVLGEGGRDALDASAWQSRTVLLGDYGEINYNADVKNTETLESATSVRVDEGDNDNLTGGSANDILIGGAGSDSLTGGGGDDVIFGDNGRVSFINGLPALMETFDSYPESDVRAPAEIPGGNDVIEGNAGNDWLFGGNGDDRLFGGDGDDIINGDGGKLAIEDERVVAETTGFFIGGVDFIDGGRGDDWMLGGAKGDLFVGNLADDIIIGDYARITVENNKGLSVVRLGQDKLDLIASTLFTLYTPDVLLFGPAAIGGIIPSGSAATAYEPVYNTISEPVGSRGQETEPEPAPEPDKTAEELAFEQALITHPPAAGDNADIKPATPEVKTEIPKVEEDRTDCIRIKGERLGVSELWSQLLKSDSFDEAVGVASDMIDVIITGESKKLPDKVDCRPVDQGDHGTDDNSSGDHSALEMPVLALSGLLGMQAYTKTKQSADNRVQFNRNAFERLERESQARRYSSW